MYFSRETDFTRNIVKMSLELRVFYLLSVSPKPKVIVHVVLGIRDTIVSTRLCGAIG